MDTKQIEHELTKKEDIRGVSSSVLKNAAYIFMFIDHFFCVIFYHYVTTLQGIEKQQANTVYRVGRGVGRVAFILFAFMIAEGMRHTRNRMKFLLGLLMFAVISEIPFDLANSQVMLDWKYQNVYFTLFLGALAIELTESWKDKTVLQILTVFGCLMAAIILRVDYMVMGVILILCMYYLGKQPLGSLQKVLLYVVSAVVMFAGTVSNNVIRYWLKHEELTGQRMISITKVAGRELFGLFAFVLIFFYNGKKGKQLPKYFYYFIYPVHLFIFYIIDQAVF